MVKHHGFSKETLENEYPFERDINVQLVMQYLQEIDEKRRNQTVSQPGFGADDLRQAGVDKSKFSPGELDLYR
jgi:hypothetical protein